MEEKPTKKVIVYPHSPQMVKHQIAETAYEPGYDDTHGNSDYPFDQLWFGESFAVFADQASELSLSSAVGYHNRKYKMKGIPKRFKLLRHVTDTGVVYEVGRIL